MSSSPKEEETLTTTEPSLSVEDVIFPDDIDITEKAFNLPCTTMIFGDLQYPIDKQTLHIRDGSIIVKAQITELLPDMEPLREDFMQFQLSLYQVTKILLLPPDDNDGATCLCLCISDVAVMKLTGAFQIALKENLGTCPSRRFLFFDLILNVNNPIDRDLFYKCIVYMEHCNSLNKVKRLAGKKDVLSEKDYTEFEQQQNLPFIGFVKSDMFHEMLAAVGVKLVPTKDTEYKHLFLSCKTQIIRAEKRMDPRRIVEVKDMDGNKLDRKNVYVHHTASGVIEFNFKDLTCLNPSGWLNDKIVDWYCYRLFKTLPQEKQSLIQLCETYFYSSITKRIENETHPAKIREGIYHNYDMRKFKQNFFKFKFIIIPVHRLNHWFLIVIMNPQGALSPVDLAEVPEDASPCYFIIFDSFTKLAVNEHDTTFDHLTHFLTRHYNQFKAKGSTDTFNRALVKKVFPEEMPQQPNADDCGIYSLMFLKFFFEHLPEGDELPAFTDWWSTFTIAGMREKIRQEILNTATNSEEMKKRQAPMVVQPLMGSAAKRQKVTHLSPEKSAYPGTQPLANKSIVLRSSQSSLKTQTG